MAATVAIVTCGPELEVAFQGEDQPAPSLVRLGGRSPRSTLLLAAIDLLVEDAKLERSAIERVVVTRGPGSFTGIRAGLATAAGIEAAADAKVIAYDSLTVQAARCHGPAEVWAAQPGRRGEVYTRRFRVEPNGTPVASGELSIMTVAETSACGPWVAASSLDLGGADRAQTVRSAAEALLELDRSGVPSQPVEPLYVEAPPIHKRGIDG